ncbi:MAG: hypothetical protein IJZ96_05555, partial [Lachnospiraceae bacterium]|nr:hypothetical protein [Lachnospiraceae bacterium]
LEAVDDNEKFINFIKAYERFRARDYVRCNEHIKYFKECMIAELKKHISEDGLRLRKGQIEDDIEIYSQYILECFKSLNFDDSFKENLKHMYFGDVNSQENPNLYAYEIWKSMLILYVNDTKGIQIDVDKILEDNYLTDDNRQNSLLSEIINQLDSMSDDEFYEKFLEFSYNNNALQKNKSKISRDISYCNADFYFKYCGDDIAQLYMNNDKYLSVENGYMYETMAGVRCDNNVMLNYVDSLKIHNNIDSIKLEKILRLHSVLKQERNNTNHASEKCIRLPLAVINKAINLYVKWVKEIINLI